MPEDTQLAISFIKRLSAEQFWGDVTLKLQHGQVIHITKEESLKPSQLEPEYRRNHEPTDR